MKQALEILKSLSDRNRLRVVAALMHVDELCACQIVELLNITGASASRHMGLLLHSGVVQSRKDGRWVYYRLVKSLDARLGKWLKGELLTDKELAADRELLHNIVACEPEELCRRQRGEACCPS